VYNITVFFKDNFSGLVRSDTFELTVSCVRSIALRTPLTTVDYWITDAAQTSTPLYDLTPSDCPYELVLTMALSDGSSLPPAIRNTDPSVTISESNYALIGAYVVKIVATDPKTSVTNNNAVLNVTVHCIKSVNLTANIILSYTYGIVLAKQFTKTVALPSYHITPTQCAS
jgi:hypothetical protein